MSREPLSLSDESEWSGLWWLPDEPQQRVPGTLRYTPDDGLRVTLIGAFEDRIVVDMPGGASIDQGARSWDRILGVANQREITLLGCVPTASRRTFGARVKSPDQQTIVATSALIGVHVGNEDEPAFSRCDVSVEDLGEWAGSSVLSGSISLKDGRLSGGGSIVVTPVEEPSVRVDGAEFVLAHRYTSPFFDRRRGELIGRVRDTAFVRIRPDNPCSLRDAFAFARFVEDLVSLATHRAAGVIWLRLRGLSLEPATADGPSRDLDVDVLYPPARVGHHDAKATESRNIFFTCDDIPFVDIIPRWSEVYGRLRAASNMILGLRYAPPRYVENNLLVAVGAAEVLHRELRISESPIPAKEFKAIREDILQLVPAQHQERIKSALRNDPTLRDRLRALALRPDADAIARLVPDVDRWATVTTRARNDLAHEGQTPRQSVDDLIAVVNVTSAVVILNLLHELGLATERQREIVKNHPEWRSTANHAWKWLATSTDDS
ncbi:ApeA N-terminal domain 1-containing protein [Nocardioides campestrisoli]|uniref:ApeA N-terminal domain 1-containing protein n=1 Tax=Nocardioides campestrisoli TaxID=2736757 RepID=UPI00163DE1D3|nr:HEPN domain-containing protein [Nocardioides campestrisoli]